MSFRPWSWVEQGGTDINAKLKRDLTPQEVASKTVNGRPTLECERQQGKLLIGKVWDPDEMRRQERELANLKDQRDELKRESL